MHGLVGTLPGWLTLLALLGFGRAIVRGGGGQAVEILQTANGVLAKRIDVQDALIQTQAAQIAVLQGKTDVTLALRPIVEEMKRHEEHAAQRSEAIVAALERVAA